MSVIFITNISRMHLSRRHVLTTFALCAAFYRTMKVGVIFNLHASDGFSGKKMN